MREKSVGWKEVREGDSARGMIEGDDQDGRRWGRERVQEGDRRKKNLGGKRECTINMTKEDVMVK